MSEANNICCLCGKPATDTDPLTREHVPPQQFYPKSLRPGLQLWIEQTHKSCNAKDKDDEEYFYHALYPMVANTNPKFGNVILNDLKRRGKKPQTRTLLRSILRTSRTTSQGGIHLPQGVVRLNANEHRLQQVAIKIGRCLFYRDHKRVMPYENCKDIRLCERDTDVPELYTISWEMSKTSLEDLVPLTPGGRVVMADTDAGQAAAACQKVFSYRSASVEGLHLYTLMFWEAFVYCMAFENPQP